jgi:hypothetical protein
MYQEQLHQEEVNGFVVTTYILEEHTHPRDLFDYEEEEIQELCRKIDNGCYQWFAVRVEASKRGIILGRAYLGGCLYDNAIDFIKDDYYEDLVHESIKEAKQTLKELNQEWLIEAKTYSYA